IAHDFNNILMAIMGHAEMALLDLSPDHPLYKDMKTIKELGQLAANLTQRLLTFARRHMLNKANISLNKLITGLNKLISLSISEDIEVKTILASEPDTIHADSNAIEQILLNLCINANDAMPRGGKITIETSNITIDETFSDLPPWIKPGNYVLVAVSDTGVGIDSKTKQRIFDPFFTTKEPTKGTGLGLSVTYGLVKQHNGMIHVYSEINKGTIFKVYLPVVDSKTKELLSGENQVIQKGTETILVAEDNKDVRIWLQSMLTAHDYNIILAADGEEALELFNKHESSVDLIISDVVMPKLNGRELYDQLKKKKKDCKFLFITGYGFDNIQEKFAIAKNVEFIQKPFSIVTLTNKIREILRKSPEK
ncbi:MAG: response regulator, partial [Planctomycetes bacterium]|nr:response regulator [Planctomycetota bacterium]